MIDFDHVKDYLPVAKTESNDKTKVLFAFVKEDMLLGQKLSDKKIVFAVNIMCLLPSQVGYRKGIFRLAPSRFVSLLEPFGYTKNEYLFVVETVETMPEKFQQILNPQLYAEMEGQPLGVVETKARPKPKHHRGKKKHGKS